MRVAVVGSRRFTDLDKVVDYVNNMPVSDTVVSGGCEGVDTWAIEAAIARGMKWQIFYPDLSGTNLKYYERVQRYYDRNERVVLNSDMVVAFVSKDRKGGTENTIKWAQKYNKPVMVMKEKE